ncbi:MAG: transketolase, partial [Chloroflexi bacterium]|nr:transketolase [Chloroflexota bacterium]
MISNDKDIHLLEQIAKNIRINTLKGIASAGAGHPGAALSVIEVLVCLYFKIMKIDPQKPQWEDRDRLVLSKGHASIGLYSVLAEKGYFPKDELQTFDHVNSRLQGHPDLTKTPGVDMSCGSLGQGLSAGVGMALAARLQKKDCHIYVLMG